MLRLVVAGTILWMGTAAIPQNGPPLTQKTQPAPAAINDFHEVDSHRLSNIEPIRVMTDRSVFESIHLEVTVNASGAVAGAEVLEGPEKLRAAAIAQAMTWRYKPFERGGKPALAKFEEYIQLLPQEKLPKTHVPFPDIHDWNSLRMSLSRTGCFGTCPSYTVEVRGDGTVEYLGKSDVLILGEHHYHISQDAVREMVEAFRHADYFSMESQYEASVTDNPTYITSISFTGSEKSVTDYVGEEVGMPHVVKELERSIDRISGSLRWTKGNAETVPSLTAEQWDFKSPQAAQVLAKAAGNDSFEVVRDLLTAGVVSNGAGGGEALANAAAKRDRAMVSVLLDAGAGTHNLKQMDTALASAASAGDLELVRLMIKHGANPNSRDEDRRTVLMRAADSGVAEVVSEILKYHPDVNARSKQNRTAIYYATVDIRSSQPENASPAAVVRLLAQAGADASLPDEHGNSPLHETVDEDAARALVAAGADVNLRNEDGKTPLMETVSAEIARILIDAGADVMARDDDGKTALDHSREDFGGMKDKIAVLESAIAGRKNANPSQ